MMETLRACLDKSGRANDSDLAPSLVHVQSMRMPEFNEKEDIDVFLTQFERIAKVQNWPETQWATRVATLLTGKASEVYTQLPMDL